MMKKGTNQNHPKKGDFIKVGPIREIKDIETIKKLLADKPRDLCLFTLGINTNLRASDLLRLKVGQVRGLKPGDEIELKEKKTGKVRRINLNINCISSIEKLLASREYKNDDLLFLGQRGPLTVPSVTALVKKWCGMVNLKGNYGAHSLRKTWGYHQRVTFGKDIPTLMDCFGHATQKQTLEYLCIQPEEIKSVFENCL